MTKSPAGDLYRIARSRTPWQAYKDTPFTERFDDPRQTYFVLYASSHRLGCFMECLAYFRVNPNKPGFAELEEKFGARFPDGTVPPGWCSERCIQSAEVVGKFADVAHSDWIAKLLRSFPRKWRDKYTYPWVDQSTVYQDKFREITQWISREVFECTEPYMGLNYSSKHGSNFVNWAIFEERATIAVSGALEPINETDPDLLKACELLEIRPPSGARVERA